MTITRQRVAAALLTACFACFAGTALAAAGPDAQPAAGPQEPGNHGPGPGMNGHGMPGPGMGFDDDMHGAHDMHGMHGGLMMQLHRLNLSEAKRDKLFNIVHAAAPEQHEHMKAIRKAHEALAELSRAERFDDAKASALSRELGQAIAAEALLQARTEAQALAVLSPEQRDQLRRHRTPGPQMRPRAPQDAPDAQAPQRRP